MKKFIFFAAFFFLILKLNNCFSQDDWKLLCTGNEMYSSHFINENTGWIFAGNIRYKTTDGGNNWSSPLLTSPSVGFSGGAYFTYPNFMSFSDSLHGWACQDYLNTLINYKILKTTDGGETWNTITPDLPNQVFRGISFINSLTGWLAGDKVYKTTNGGINWLLISNQKAASIALVNENLGFIISDSDTLSKTTNGGLNWELKKISNNLNVERQLKFVDESNLWIVDSPGAVFRTSNSGTNWTQFSAPSGSSVNSLFLNNSIGWLSIVGNKLYKSTNGGQSWFNQLTPNVSIIQEHVYRNIYFKNENTGWVLNNDGILLKSSNGGSNWDAQVSPPVGTIKKIDFYNVNTGFCITDYGLWKTTNKGALWVLKYGTIDDATDSYMLNDFQIINENQIIVIGNYGLFLSSTNGGTTWSNLTFQSNNLNGSYFVNENTGWLCGNSGLIAKTTNAGFNFSYQTSNISKKVNDIYFSNLNDGFAVGDTGIVLRTYNGGQNWSNIFLGDLELSKIKFTDSLNGFIIGNRRTSLGVMYTVSRNVVYKTTDAGNSWVRIVDESYTAIGAYRLFNNINFISPSEGYLLTFGTGSGIRKTTDGGLSWFNVTPPIQNTYYSMCYLDENNKWIAGGKGTVLAISPTVGIVNINSSIPSQINLKQNYPNPFNPNTNIEFSITKSSITKLIIYDITGREITRLVNEILSAGEYKVTWDAAKYPSGIYYYKIILNDYSETKKMVLIK